MTATETHTYVCPFCRLASDSSGPACPHCGAPVDVRRAVSGSGWQEQPAIKDMARIRFGRSSCQIEGTYVPVADFNLAGEESVFFSHHTLLWTEPTIQLQPMRMSGTWNRVHAGLPLVMLEAHGPGHLALSDDHPGEVVAVPLQQGQSVWVREGRFLAVTANVSYTWQQSGIWIVTGNGDDRETHYPLGMFGDLFHAPSGPGLVLLHSPGNTFIKDLAPREPICIQPSSLLYKDPSVGMSLHIEYPNTRGMSWRGRYSYRQIWLRLWGPGRVAMQSIFTQPESSNQITSHSPATFQSW
jgi:uncharacterized protein (AIM24 family)